MIQLLRTTSSRRLRYLAASLVLVALVAFTIHRAFAPTTLRIAVGPMGAADLRVIVAFLQVLNREKASVRLKLTLTDGSSTSAKALADGKVDLAVARSDISLPPTAATVAILRRDAVLFVTRPGSEIARVADLRGKTVALFSNASANERILDLILTHHDVPVKEVLRINGAFPEMLAALQEGRADAAFIVAPSSERPARMALQAFPKMEGQSAGLLVVPEADALVEANPAFDTTDILRGAYGGNPAVPENTVTTLAVPHRLLASRTLDDGVVSELTRLLFSLRPQIAAEVSLANQIELPSTDDKGARFPTHPGTIAYVEGDTKTFFERYGDYLYLGIMGISLLGSGAAALFSTGNGRRPVKSKDLSGARALGLIEAAQAAPDAETLHRIETDIRALINETLIINIEEPPDAAYVGTLSMLFAEMRQAVLDRRIALMRSENAA